MGKVIDIHAYSVAMPELYSAKAHVFGERGWGLGTVGPDESVIARCADWNVEFLDQVGTDVQFIGPRPYHLSCGRESEKLVRTWTRLYNGTIAAQCAHRPDRLAAIGALPQCVSTPPSNWVRGLLSDADEFEWVGLVLNPDPGEGDGATPGLGDPFWYPVWELVVLADLPVLIISGASRAEREGYSSHYVTESSIAALSVLENEELFKCFPKLKLIITYGGGALPYQMGRWRARRLRQPEREPFETSLRRLYFDTVVHSPAALELLLRTCGVEQCLFGTQRPGAATVKDPLTGRSVDDLKPEIQAIPWLSEQDRDAIFSENALRVFSRFQRGGREALQPKRAMDAPTHKEATP